MKLEIIGSGGAFSFLDKEKRFGNTSMYIDSGNPETSLLFDMGRNFLEQAVNINFDVQKIRNVYISHLHSDHIGSLPDFALMCYFFPHLRRPNLYAKHQIIKCLWNNYLVVMLGTLAESQLPEGKKEATFHDYFNVNSIKNNKGFVLGDVEFLPLQTVHVLNGLTIMDSFGLIFTAPSGKRILITGDTQFNPEQLRMAFDKADIIIMDCELGCRSGVHANYEDLKTLPSLIKEKMYLIHYSNEMSESIKLRAIEEDGFRGILKPGDVLNL